MIMSKENRANHLLSLSGDKLRISLNEKRAGGKQMKKIFKKVMAVSLVVALGLSLAGCGQSQPAATGGQKEAAKKIEYPTKAVTVIHGFKPGGGSDQLSQMVQPFLEKDLKVQFANVYKTGADGAIAWKEIAHSTKPDGYTLSTLLTKTILNSLINKEAGYTMADFKPIAQVVWDPGILVVAPDSPYKTAQELIDYAKKNPGKLKMTNSGTGGDDWYTAVMIEKLSGAKMNHIPFEGDAPAWQAVAGGHADANSTNASVVTSLVKGGKLRALAVYADKRLPEFPDVPTLKELGINLVQGSARGYLAPKDTPQEIVDILANAIEKVTKDPEFIKATKAGSLEIIFKKGDDYAKALKDEEASMKKVIDEMGLSHK
jgi:putative tricarboxylic transport membrane protein